MNRKGSINRIWRLGRIYFRRVRMTVWLCVLAFLGGLFYLNQVGLPAFVKRPLLEKLRARGIELQFSRLRLRFTEGVVAENVVFGQVQDPLSPVLSLSEVQVQLNPAALVRLQIQVDGLVLRGGKLVWPVASATEPPRRLTIDKIQTDLRLLPDDQWSLDNFKALFAGAKIQLSGTIFNGSALRENPLFRGGGGQSAAAWQRRIQRLADTLETIYFSSPPELVLDVRGDARDLQSFRVRMMLGTPGAETPWGTVSCGRFFARVSPARGTEASRADISLEAADAQTRWACTTNLQITVHVVPVDGRTNQVRADLALKAEQVDTRWASVTNAEVSAQWIHSLTNPVPLSGQAELRTGFASTRWGSAREVRFSAGGSGFAASNGVPAVDKSWGAWAALAPFLLDWEGRATGLELGHVEAADLALAGKWQAPSLSITNFVLSFDQGKVELAGGLDVASRVLTARAGSDADPHLVSAWLTNAARRALADCSWPEPPRLRADFAFTLPPWTNANPDWGRQIWSTLGLNGEARLNLGGAYRGVSVTSAFSHLSYSNRVWFLPDLALVRPDSRLDAMCRLDDLSGDVYWRLRSGINPDILRPLLEPQAQSGFELAQFTKGPDLDAEIWGNVHDLSRLGVWGRVAVTNFTFRGETATGLQTSFHYTNRVLQLFEPRIQRGEQHMSADSVSADFNADVVYLTNGQSTTDPMVIARAIGTNIAEVVKPYTFIQPPVGRVNGIIPLHGDEAADVHFDLDGGPFRWWKFNLTHVAGHLHWRGKHLTLSNLRADCYDGTAAGSAAFDFTPREGEDYQFDVTTVNTSLQTLMADLSDRTNRLEGRLNGTLIVTSANTVHDQAVEGYGSARLTNGLIWDIPLFGVFSPILDGIAPGLGSSPANAGACTFTIHKSGIQSDDLEIRSPAMRLHYRGNVGLDGRLNARVEAEVLRDMWLIGPVVSTVFWPFTKIFEYRVTGTLNEPKTEPLFLIPKIMMLPFHPVRTIRGLKSETPYFYPTNAPPASVPEK